MLYVLSHLIGFAVEREGHLLGALRDVYYDDISWTVHYFAIDTGKWRPREQLILSANAIKAVDVEHRIIDAVWEIEPEYPAPICKAVRSETGYTRLRSATAMAGHFLCATDGEAGQIRAFLLDDKDWRLTYLLLDSKTSHGRAVAIPTAHVDTMRRTDEYITVDLTRDEIEHSPRLAAASCVELADQQKCVAYYDQEISGD